MKQGTRWNQNCHEHTIKGFVHRELENRDRQGVQDMRDQIGPTAIGLSTVDSSSTNPAAPDSR